MLEEFVQLQGFHQLVDFPTHEDGNTLDLIISDFDGTTKAAAHLENSDHVSIAFELQVGQEIAVDAAPLPTRNWRKAPWTHIRGEVKRRTKDWAPQNCQSVSEAEAELDDILWEVVDQHMKFKAPTRPRLRPWWTSLCQRTYERKLKAFSARKEHPATYSNSKERCKKIQDRAFASYNARLFEELKEMDKSDKGFWELTKRVSGLQQTRHKAAPDAEALADHFAQKMSNATNEFDNNWTHFTHWKGNAKRSCFKIGHEKVFKQLKSVDVHKSMNGIPYIFLKERADELCTLPLRMLDFEVAEKVLFR